MKTKNYKEREKEKVSETCRKKIQKEKERRRITGVKKDECRTG